MIYMIGGLSFDTPFKVGYSRDVQRRLKDMNTYTPYPVYLLGEFHVETGFQWCDFVENQDGEKVIHTALEPYRQHREWFKCSDLSEFERAIHDHPEYWIDCEFTDYGWILANKYDDDGLLLNPAHIKPDNEALSHLPNHTCHPRSLT